MPKELTALPHMNATTITQSKASCTRNLFAVASHKALISCVAALLSLLFVLTENANAPSSYFSISNGDNPNNEFVLTPQGFSFAEPRRLIIDGGTQPDIDKAAVFFEPSAFSSQHLNTGPLDCRTTFDQRRRHFCKILNPRAPPSRL
ncbi:hypothetical protein [Zhongshania aliphaticivorans]|uniref:hypothetical protein n=1 Tax=Zhongshania aliphaticivorans TaxID=1470434 RepID=UPI0039C95FE8